MNKRVFQVIWVLTPVVVLAWHFGPGQQAWQRDKAASHLADARAAGQGGDWQLAVASLKLAEEALPGDDAMQRHLVAFARAKSRIAAGEILEGMQDLRDLLAVIETDGSPASANLATSVRHELGMTGYYAAWIMRLEGATVDEWKPEVEAARQQFRMLAEQAEDAVQQGDASKAEQAEQFKKNLEAAIRLEQMDLSVLLGLPLPKNCPKCNGSLSQQKRKQRMSQCKGGDKPGEGEQDSRKKVNEAKGAGMSRRQGSGS